MADYKSKSIGDEDIFISTRAYYKLFNTFKSLKNTKGRFIQVIGSPGTGKSLNIYHAIDNLDITVYEPVLVLDSVNLSPWALFQEIFSVFKNDFQVNSNREVYKKAADYDMILFADKFLDSEFLEKDKVGLSKWIEHKGLKAVSIYILVLWEIIKHHRELKDKNVVLHHSMVVRYHGNKYDFLTDFGLLSWFIRGFMGLFFEYVMISYGEDEILKIVNTCPHYRDEKQIRKLIKRYGNRPRLILKALENK